MRQKKGEREDDGIKGDEVAAVDLRNSANVSRTRCPPFFQDRRLHLSFTNYAILRICFRVLDKLNDTRRGNEDGVEENKTSKSVLFL